MTAGSRIQTKSSGEIIEIDPEEDANLPSTTINAELQEKMRTATPGSD